MPLFGYLLFLKSLNNIIIFLLIKDLLKKQILLLIKILFAVDVKNLENKNMNLKEYTQQKIFSLKKLSSFDKYGCK